jgi:fructokinase
MSDAQWILGLSIEEKFSWAAVQVEKVGVRKFGYSEGPHACRAGGFPDLGGEETDVVSAIENALASFRDEHSDIEGKIAAVGVSTIGIVDPDRKFLRRVARASWGRTKVAESADRPLVDFDALVERVFGRKIQVRIQNDATAKALAEHQWQDEDDRRDLIFYAEFNVGVNGGLVDKGLPLAWLSHQELGHIFPRLHEADFNFNPAFSGCPVHTGCFEGVASGARLRKQWIDNGENAYEDKNHGAWDIMAYYIAHFCWTVTLVVPVERILIGGTVIFDELIPKVIGKYAELNKGHLAAPYVHYDRMDDLGFIRRAKLRGNEGALGALELARLELEHAPMRRGERFTVVK